MHGRHDVFERWKSLVLKTDRDWPAWPSLRVVDLFCSVGGLSLGVAEAAAEMGYGFRPVTAIDADARASAVYKANFRPNFVTSESVTRLVQYELGEAKGGPMILSPRVTTTLAAACGNVDLVLAGPPCQGHSGFNNRDRRVDARNVLYLAPVAFALAVDAEAVLIENVPEVTRSKPNVVDIAIRTLEEAGYRTDHAVLKASDLGWPQSRRRHFLVASKKGVPSLRETASRFAGPAPGAAAFLDMLPRRSSLMEAVPAYDPRTRERIEHFLANGNQYDLPLEKRPPCHRAGTTYKAVYGRMKPDEPIPTITSGFLTPGRGRFLHPTKDRTLTPGEAAYVQGFPSWFDFEFCRPSRKELEKWIGDAVPLPLGYVAAMAVLSGLLE